MMRGAAIRAVVVGTFALLSGAVIWSAATDHGGAERASEARTAVPFGGSGDGALAVAVGDRDIWTVGLGDRRLRSFAVETLEPSGKVRTVGAVGDRATDLAVGRGAVWVALLRSGTGAVVRLEPRGGRRRVL